MVEYSTNSDILVAIGGISMDNDKCLSLDFSILYRCTQKYYDKALKDLDINAGQLSFLTIINENEGLSMNSLAEIGSFDKGTVSKEIQKLVDLGYVLIENGEDKRVRILFLSNKAKEIMPKLYMLRRDWWEFLTSNIDKGTLENYLDVRNEIVNKAKEYLNVNNTVENIKFFGIQKTTLLDYPGKLASTLFTGGCNFRCPFCHNGELVFLKESVKEIATEDILSFLEKRKGILDGVCITGGEPLINKGLKSFIEQVKALGYKVKLDTNGSKYEELKDLYDNNLLDYVAIDIKNSKEKYGRTIGIESYDLTNIEKSIELLKTNKIPYEFRTTVVSEFHEESDFEKIGLWLKGAKNYYLQCFRDGDDVIEKGLHSPSEEALNKYKSIMEKYVDNVEIRGV